MESSAVIFQYASIGDYVFLIMIVVVSIIQAIAQNKKKKELMEQEKQKPLQRKTVDPDEDETYPLPEYDTPIDNIYDSIERMLIPDTAEAVDESKHKWGDDYTEPASIKPIATDMKVTPVAGNVSDYADKIPPAPGKNVRIDQTAKLKKERPAKTRKSSIRKGFNLRQAVIYSEILNRKYT